MRLLRFWVCFLQYFEFDKTFIGYFLEKEKNEIEAMVSAVSLDQKVKLLEPVVNKYYYVKL